MNKNSNEIYHLLLEASEKKIIEVKPSLLDLSYEELLTYEDTLSVTMGDKKYLITFNPNYVIKTTTKNVQRVNRGCSLIKDLLEKVFNEYNILVVPDAKIDTKLLNETIRNILPPVDDAYTLDFDIQDSEKTLDDFKIELGYSIEFRDSFEGSLEIHHFLSKCNVNFENEQPILSYDIEFKPNSENAAVQLDEIKIDAKEKKDYLERINQILMLFKNDYKEENKKDILRNTFENKRNVEIRQYLEERLEAAKANSVENPQIDFNIIPVSISLNKIQNKKIILTLIDNENPDRKASMAIEKFDPFKPNELKIYCGCGEEITAENRMLLLTGLDGKTVIGCEACACQDDSGKHPGVWFAKEAIVFDSFDNKLYYKGDCMMCDVDGKYHYNANLIRYDVLATGKQPVSGYCLKKYIQVCPNCHAAIAGTEDDFDDYLISSIESVSRRKGILYCKGGDVVCCQACVDGNTIEDAKSDTYQVPDKKFATSDVSGFAFLPNDYKNAAFSELTDEEIVGSKEEFVKCRKCDQIVALNEYNAEEHQCEHCAEHIESRDTVPDEINAFIKEFYPEYYSDSYYVNTEKNFYDDTVYRFEFGKKLLVVKVHGYEIIFSKLSKK